MSSEIKKSPDINLKKEPTEKQMRAELRIRGYQFIDQKPGQEKVEINAQEVVVPFTNTNCEVIVKKGEDGRWKYVSRGMRGHDFLKELGIIYDVEFSREI